MLLKNTSMLMQAVYIDGLYYEKGIIMYKEFIEQE